MVMWQNGQRRSGCRSLRRFGWHCWQRAGPEPESTSRVRSSQTPHHGGLPVASISLCGQLAAMWPSPLQSKHFIQNSGFRVFAPLTVTVKADINFSKTPQGTLHRSVMGAGLYMPLPLPIASPSMSSADARSMCSGNARSIAPGIRFAMQGGCPSGRRRPSAPSRPGRPPPPRSRCGTAGARRAR